MTVDNKDNKLIELTTYEEVPQLLKMPLSSSPFPNNVAYYLLTGITYDSMMYLAGFYPVWYFLPITAIIMTSKLFWDEYIKWQLINMKAIRQTTETIEQEPDNDSEDEQDNTDTYTVSHSLVNERISRDKQLNGFLLTGKDYDALASYYALNDDNGFRRDDSANGKGAKSICSGVTNANFGFLSQALKSHGYIDEKNNWTNAGYYFLGFRYDNERS